MAEPKKKTSKSRTHSRRNTNSRVTLNGVAICSHCKKPTIPHRMCSHCGYYAGRKIKEMSSKKSR